MTTEAFVLKWVTQPLIQHHSSRGGLAKHLSSVSGKHSCYVSKWHQLYREHWLLVHVQVQFEVLAVTYKAKVGNL